MLEVNHTLYLQAINGYHHCTQCTCPANTIAGCVHGICGEDSEGDSEDSEGDSEDSEGDGENSEGDGEIVREMVRIVRW